MTRFERDLQEALNGNEIEVLKRRKAEIKTLESELKKCKNGFKAQCIAQELDRLKKQYNEIEANF